MKNALSKFALIFILGFLVVLAPSCKKDDNTPKSEIIGTWTMGNPDITITAGGIDLVQYLISTYGLTAAQAQAALDMILEEFTVENSGTIAFKDDNTYHVSQMDGNEDGTWSITNDGKTLNLNSQVSGEDSLSIKTLTSNLLILGLAPITEEVDFNEDGIDETTLVITIELRLTK